MLYITNLGRLDSVLVNLLLSLTILWRQKSLPINLSLSYMTLGGPNNLPVNTLESLLLSLMILIGPTVNYSTFCGPFKSILSLKFFVTRYSQHNLGMYGDQRPPKWAFGPV